MNEQKSAYIPEYMIPVGDGFILPVKVEDVKGLELKQASPSFLLTEYGVSISIGKMTMPVSVAGLQHLIDNGQFFHVYASMEAGYMCDFVTTVSLERDQLLKLLGSWETLYGCLPMAIEL